MSTADKCIGILVFTTQEVLEHKQRDGKRSNGRWCFWETNRFPKQFLQTPDAEYRLYFAVKGIVKGYFIIDDDDGDGELYFDSNSWKEITNGEKLKPSQGWRYYLHDNYCG